MQNLRTWSSNSNPSPETVCYTQSTIPIKEGNWKIILENKDRPQSLPTAISKFVTTLLRHCDLKERDAYGAPHRDSIHSKLMKQFGANVKKNFSQRDSLEAIHEGSNKKRFEYCMNSKNQGTYIRAIQGHQVEVGFRRINWPR